MPSSRHPCTSLALAVISAVATAALPACQITVREPQVAPLNPVAIFPATIADTCPKLRHSLQLLGATFEEDITERDACLYETDHLRLTGDGVPINRLDQVAYVGNQNFFARGRYLITAAARPTTDGNTRVRLTARIEGYDGDYRVLRSRGLIERTVIGYLADALGVQPIEE